MRHLYTLDQGIDKHREMPKVAGGFSGSERIPQTKPTERFQLSGKVYNTSIPLIEKLFLHHHTSSSQTLTRYNTNLKLFRCE
jgi:hypothetical protein